MPAHYYSDRHSIYNNNNNIYKENARARGYDLLGPAYLDLVGIGIRRLDHFIDRVVEVVRRVPWLVLIGPEGDR